MNELTIPAPEWVEVANSYLTTGDIDRTAAELQIHSFQVSEILAKKEVRRYLDNVYLDLGYRNRSKIGEVMDLMIESKLEEARETGMYTSKDLADLLMMAHKMRMDEIKASVSVTEIKQQTNIQVNDQGNYGNLVDRLLNGANSGSK